MNPLVTSSGYTGPRVACREAYACGADETHLLQRAGLTLNWLIGPGRPVIRPLGLEELYG